MRRGSVVQLVVIGVLLGAGATLVALLIPWLPASASDERDGIDLVFWFVTAVSIAIFSLVGAIILYSVFKFRARPDDDSDGPPIHGHTGLEIVWTAIPAILVTAISVMSGIVLIQNDRASGNSMTVEVTAQQFAWSFKYPEAKDLTAATLRLPLGRSVELKLTSKDVIHSFWVPQFGQKQDALPGSVTHLVITPTKLGEFPVVCTELCGLGHALMRSQAIVMKPAAFDAWLRRQQTALAGPPSQAGKSVFAANGCGSCHTLKAAGTTAKIGPDLDKLPAQAQKAGRPLEQFIRESIVDPNAYVESGFLKNVMPQTYAQLPKDQLDALVSYLASAGKRG